MSWTDGHLISPSLLHAFEIFVSVLPIAVTVTLPGQLFIYDEQLLHVNPMELLLGRVLFSFCYNACLYSLSSSVCFEFPFQNRSISSLLRTVCKLYPFFMIRADQGRR